eukprot:6209097-Pleurochrysis_carterae.AAC.2
MLTNTVHSANRLNCCVCGTHLCLWLLRIHHTDRGHSLLSAHGTARTRAPELQLTLNHEVTRLQQPLLAHTPGSKTDSRRLSEATAATGTRVLLARLTHGSQLYVTALFVCFSLSGIRARNLIQERGTGMKHRAKFVDRLKQE